MKNGDERLTPKDIINGIGAFILLLVGGSIFKLMLDFFAGDIPKSWQDLFNRMVTYLCDIEIIVYIIFFIVVLIFLLIVGLIKKIFKRR